MDGTPNSMVVLGWMGAPHNETPPWMGLPLWMGPPTLLWCRDGWDPPHGWDPIGSNAVPGGHEAGGGGCDTSVCPPLQ